MQGGSVYGTDNRFYQRTFFLTVPEQPAYVVALLNRLLFS